MKIFYFSVLVMCIVSMNFVKCNNFFDDYFSQPSNEEYTGNKIRKSLPYFNYEESPVHPFIRFKKNNINDKEHEFVITYNGEPSAFEKRFYSRHQMALRHPISYGDRKYASSSNKDQ
uniref:Uncharacterized protein n=1 Tax=Parastrongyloides trichosuri TaxID=131310 RepID=A0A0N4ZBV3_PARTI